MNTTTKGWIAAIGVALLWGTEGSLATMPLQTIDAKVLVWLRYLIAFSVLCVVLVVASFAKQQTLTKNQSLTKKPPLTFRWKHRQDILKLAVCGIVGQGLFSFFSFQSLDYITISENGVIQGLVPIAILFVGYLCYGERFSALQILAVGVALCGVTLLVFAPSTDASGLNIGHFYCLMSVMSFASVTHIRAQLADKYGAACTMCYQFGFAAIGFLAYLLSTDVNIQTALLLAHQPFALTCVMILGLFVSGIGYLVYIYGIEQVGVDSSSMALNLMPMSAFFIATTFFDEPVTPLRLFAICLIIGAMMLFAKPSRTLARSSQRVVRDS
ncbi:DMT family transporter [Vibrio sp. ZSDZ65]|uniref:DMT family transporter n=1 Tax=Vibrio qingdaonensis TaxID=2829491 RepID=A0A9X3CQL1_9VIBR|nr:DMT family transporter [Vibrio qingdaonensis]MCW8347906.1 DMT family transporter [Vibrio qingdaonensis]